MFLFTDRVLSDGTRLCVDCDFLGSFLLLISSPSLYRSISWDEMDDGWGWCLGIERMEYEKVCLFQVYVGFSVMDLVVGD